MVSGSDDHKIYIWDLSSRDILQVLEGHSGLILNPSSLFLRLHVVLSVTCNPTKNQIASCSIDDDLSIKIWEDLSG